MGGLKLVSPGAHVAERFQDLLARAREQQNIAIKFPKKRKLPPFFIESPETGRSREALSSMEHARFTDGRTTIDLERETNGASDMFFDSIRLKRESGEVSYGIGYPDRQLNIEQPVEEAPPNAIQPATAEQCIALIRMLDKLESSGVASSSLRDL